MSNADTNDACFNKMIDLLLSTRTEENKTKKTANIIPSHRSARSPAGGKKEERSLFQLDSQMPSSLFSLIFKMTATSEEKMHTEERERTDK